MITSSLNNIGTLQTWFQVKKLVNVNDMWIFQILDYDLKCLLDYDLKVESRKLKVESRK